MHEQGEGGWRQSSSGCTEALPETGALPAGKLQSCAWLGSVQPCVAPPQPYSICDQATMDEKGSFQMLQQQGEGSIALRFCLLCFWWPRGATRLKPIYHFHAGAASRKVNPQCFVAKLFNILRSKIVNSNRNIAALLKMEFFYYFQLKRPLSTRNVINSAFV